MAIRRRGPRLKLDRETASKLVAQYLDETETTVRLAQLYGVSRPTIYAELRRAGVWPKDGAAPTTEAGEPQPK